MANEPALKEHLIALKTEYDEGLHERFLLWKDQSGNSANRIAGMINRSAAAVSQYINQIYKGDLAAIEQDIASLLRREEDLEFTVRPRQFCVTLNARLIWEVLQFCDEHHKMGVAVGPSGSGKTTTCNEYKRANRSTILVTADLTKRSIYSVLGMIAKKIGGTPRMQNNSAYLESIISRLKHSNRLIVIDEAHFLNWNCFEIIRKIHDCAQVGIAYVGQERLYDQMRGADNRAMLFDQIYGRVAIKRDDLRVERDDVKQITDTLAPGLDKGCVDFLYSKSQAKGRNWNVTNLIEVATAMSKTHKRTLDLDMLRTADEFLLKG